MSLLIIQIPCLNEEHTLPQTIGDLPRRIDGVDQIELLIIDDGSTDRTIEVARELGVQHVVRFPANRGLAAAFTAGLQECLRLGADYIVNTDGDNQYRGDCIPALVAPLVAGEADIVIGDRKTSSIAHFSWLKRRLQTLGSWVVRQFSGTSVPDATSGFRAYTRDAAMRLNLVNRYTYTLETIIQAGQGGLSIRSVPIGTNEKLRESRLFKSIHSYVTRSAGIILRSYVLYQPFKSFLTLAGVFFAGGVALGLRFLLHYLSGGGGGKIQSLILAAVLLISGVQFAIMALLADLSHANRKLAEEALLHLRRIEAKVGAQGELLQRPPEQLPPPAATPEND